MNEGLRAAWQRYFSSVNEEKTYELSELMNALELGCAIYSEHSLSGVSRKIAAEYLCASLSMLEQSDDARAAIAAMRHSPTTFEYTLKFITSAKRRGDYQKFRVALS